MDPAHERYAEPHTDSDGGQHSWRLEASNPQCSDENMLFHATGLQSGPSSAGAEDGSSPDAFRSQCGGERCRPRVSFSDVNQVFDVAKLSFRDLRGDTRDLSSTCDDPDWCSLGLARSHKLAAFAEAFILRKSFAVWYSSGLPCGSSDAHAAAGCGEEEEDLFLFAAPPTRDATCETEDGSAPSSWSSIEGHGPASGASAGVARESTAVRVRGARRCRGRGGGGGLRGNSVPSAVDTENASPYSSPPNRLYTHTNTHAHSLATPYYPEATYNSSPFLPAFPPSPSESLLAVCAARRVSVSEGEDTWSDWDSGEGDSNSNSDCSSLRPSLEMLRPSQDASLPIPIPSPHPR